MANGVNYVRNPEYDGVSGYSVNSEDIVISSGNTVVGGVYYFWDSTDGFTNQGWFTDLVGSPLRMYFDKGLFIGEGTDYEQWATEYISQYGNLNAVFKYWSEHVDKTQWITFLNAVNTKNSSCWENA